MSKRLLCVWLLLTWWLSGMPVWAQQPVTQLAATPRTATLQNAATANGNGTTLNVNGMAVAVLTVNCATCSGGTTVNFEASEDGTNFAARYGLQSGTTTLATTTTTAGVTVWEVNVSGFVTLRARISAYSAGTITVTGHAVATAGATPVTTTSLGANQSVNVAQVNGVTTTTGNGISGTGVQRVTLASDSTGQVALATGSATIGALTANQSVNAAQMNGVAVTMGNGISGTGVQRVTLASDSTGQVAVASFPDNEPLNVAQMNGVAVTMGNGISGTGVQRVTLASDSTGQVALAAGSATIGALTANQSVNVAQMNGVATAMNSGATSTGTQRVIPATDSPGMVVEDVGETAATQLFGVGTVRRDTPVSSAGTSGDNATLNTDALGRTWTRSGSVCSDEANVSSVVIENSADAQLVALSGSTVIYVCGFNLIAAGTVNARLISGTGSVCATGLTARTGTYQLTAQTGIALPNAGATQFKSAAGEALCLDVTAAVTVSGFVTYVQTATP